MSRAVALRRRLLVFAVFTAAAATAGGEPGTVAVRRETFRATATLTGQLSAESLERFVTPVSPNWRLTIRWMAEEGTAVRPGDPVVRFDTGSLQSEVESAEIDLQDRSSDSALKEAEAAAQRLDLLLDAERKRVELAKAEMEAAIPEGVRPRREHEERQLALEKARTAAETARMAIQAHDERSAAAARERAIDLEAARIALAENKDRLGGMTLVAHHEGVVILGSDWRTGRRLQEGDTTWSMQEVAKIPNLSAIMVLAWAGETELSALAPGQAVELILDAHPGRRFSGKIERIGRSADVREAWGSSPYYPVDIAIDRPDLDLMKPGMSVRCTVVTGELPDATVVPLAAVSGDAGGRFVISRGERVAVTVLAQGPFDVALEPQPRLAEGTPVETPAFEAGRVVRSAPPAALPDRTDKVVAQGRLDSRAKNSLGPQVPGVWDYTITELAPEGQSVRAGTVVVAFDDRMLRDRQQVRRSELDAARKELEKFVLDGQQQIESIELQRAESSMQADKTRRKLEVPADLLSGLDRRRQELDHELATRELDLNERRLETARANLEARQRNQQGKIARLQSDLDRIGRQIESMKVRAPRDGSVVYVDDEGAKPRVGTEVWVGRVVAEIADLGAMKVDAMVPEPDAGRVRAGQRAEVRLDVNPDRLFLGRVTELGRVFHVKSRETPSLVFDAEIALDAPDPDLMRPGMAAEVTILPDADAAGASGKAAR